jgi:Flp pilus assembly protein TadD
LNLRLITPRTLGALLVLITIAIYIPAIGAGYIWDDDTLLTANPQMRNSAGLGEIWRGEQVRDYTPVTLTLFWLECRLWGLTPTGYHVVNILLHAASALLLWLILRRLRIPGAWLAALLFAIHPVNVASVAWVAELKNTLSSALFLGSILTFLIARDEKRRLAYAGSLALFILAALSKGAVVTLPAVLILCILWRDRKITRRDLLAILPHAIIGLAAALLTIHFQARAQHYGLIPDTLEYRIARAGMAIWYYLAALVWPAGLSPMRPQWTPSLRNPLTWLPAIAAVVAPAIFYWKRRTWGRPLLFAYAYYMVMLLPVLGFVWMALMQETPSADWWQYMAAPGMFALFGAAVVTLDQRYGAAMVVAAAAAGAFIPLTIQREAIYQSMETYCRAVTAEVPHAWTLQMNLGIMLKRHGDFAGAEACYRQALAHNPRYVEAHVNLANALGASGNVPGADRELRLALQLRPGDPVILQNLASVCANEGRTNEAIAFETQAAQAEPGNRWLLRTLADMDERAGRYAHAAASYQQAIALSPGDLGSVAIRMDLCKVLSEAGKQQDALAICDQIVQMAHQTGNPATITFAERYRADCQSRPDGVFPGSEALNNP